MHRLIKKMKSMPNAALASIMFAISTFFVKGVSLIVTPIFTRIMDLEQYGIVTTYSSWVSIIEVFAFLGLTSAGVINVGLKEHKEDRRQYISSITILCNIITVLCFAIIFIIKAFFKSDFILPTHLLLIMMLHFIFQPAQLFWITAQRYEYKWKIPFFVTLVSIVLIQTIGITCLLTIDATSVGVQTSDIRIFSNVVSSLIFQIPFYILVIRQGKKIYDKQIWKATLIFSLPLLPHYLAQHVMSSSDKIMISSLNSSSGAAVYGVAMNISMVATIIWNSINASLVPFTYDKIEKNDTNRINQIVIPIIAIYAVLCVLVCLIAPEVLWVLGGEKYQDGIFAVPPIAINAFLSAGYNIYANIEFYHKKSWRIALSTIIAAALNVGLNYLLIPRMGYVGAAYTTFISNLVLVIMHYLGYRSCHPERVYNDKIVALLFTACTICCLTCNALYPITVVRYSIILIIIILAFFRREYIINKIKDIKGKG